jgi:hypothetical protein
MGAVIGRHSAAYRPHWIVGLLLWTVVRVEQRLPVKRVETIVPATKRGGGRPKGSKCHVKAAPTLILGLRLLGACCASSSWGMRLRLVAVPEIRRLLARLVWSLQALPEQVLALSTVSSLRGSIQLEAHYVKARICRANASSKSAICCRSAGVAC